MTNLDIPKIEKYVENFWKHNRKNHLELINHDFRYINRSFLQKEISNYLYSNGITTREASFLVGRNERYFETSILAPRQKDRMDKITRVFEEIKIAVTEVKMKYEINGGKEELNEMVKFWGIRKKEGINDLNLGI
ncbi:hypothetical protein [Enterococcus sp. AZ084]|uniref:hypothetical protein n=1 Tax=Enterococcus sp. AZ084 TaxID=2774671 RepID=UPI003F68E0DA